MQICEPQAPPLAVIASAPAPASAAPRVSDDALSNRKSHRNPPQTPKLQDLQTSRRLHLIHVLHLPQLPLQLRLRTPQLTGQLVPLRLQSLHPLQQRRHPPVVRLQRLGALPLQAPRLAVQHAALHLQKLLRLRGAPLAAQQLVLKVESIGLRVDVFLTATHCNVYPYTL